MLNKSNIKEVFLTIFTSSGYINTHSKTNDFIKSMHLNPKRPLEKNRIQPGGHFKIAVSQCREQNKDVYREPYLNKTITSSIFL